MNNLPIPVNTEIHIRSRQKGTPKATTRILGARYGEFIIIDNPGVKINERFTIEFEGDVICWFFHDGITYGFQSRIREKLARNIALIDYPLLVEAQRIRKHQRIPLGIETSLAVDGMNGTIRGIMEDISEGGCNISVPFLIPAVEDTSCRLDFSLLDGQTVSSIKGTVQRINHVRHRKIVKLGVRFIGPSQEHIKIISFCRFRVLFKL